MIQRSDEEILQSRAKALASARVDSGSLAETTHDRYLVVLCGTDRFVVALESVMEVFRASAVTPLPRAVAPLWGLTSWRGSILPVIAIDQSLPEHGSGVIVILAMGTRVIAGLWANQVEAEIAIDRNTIQPAQGVAGIRGQLVSGVAPDAKSVIDAESLARMLDERTKAKDQAAATNSSGIKV
jgi:chemotaxis signal transduction protein